MEIKDILKGSISVNIIMIGIFIFSIVVLIIYPKDYLLLGIPIYLICLFLAIISGVFIIYEIFLSTKNWIRNLVYDKIEKSKRKEERQKQNKLYKQNYDLLFQNISKKKRDEIFFIYDHGRIYSDNIFVRIVDMTQMVHHQYESEISILHYYGYIDPNSKVLFSCFSKISIIDNTISFTFNEYIYKLLEDRIR